MRPTLYTVTVDTEEQWDWNSGYATAGPACVENIRELPRFQEACDKHGAAVTYFVNHAVLADECARRTIVELNQHSNVEIGFHIHPWNTPPLQSVERVTPRESYLHNLPPELALAKLDTVWSAFTAAGLRPVTYRGGRYSSSPLIQDWLRDHGFRADCSVVPYTTWVDDGAPDYRSRDPWPVRLPPRGTAEHALWELPLTLGFTRRPMGFWSAALTAAERPLLAPLRLAGRLFDKLGVVRKCWLNFENPLGEQARAFLPILRRLGLPAICLTMHSSSLRAGGNPYSQSAADVQRLYERLDEVLGELARRPGDFAPATAARVAEELENDHARDRHQPAGQGLDGLVPGGRPGHLCVR